MPSSDTVGIILVVLTAGGALIFISICLYRRRGSGNTWPGPHSSHRSRSRSRRTSRNFKNAPRIPLGVISPQIQIPAIRIRSPRAQNQQIVRPNSPLLPQIPVLIRVPLFPQHRWPPEYQANPRQAQPLQQPQFQQIWPQRPPPYPPRPPSPIQLPQAAPNIQVPAPALLVFIMLKTLIAKVLRAGQERDYSPFDRDIINWHYFE
ncbi:hypothetical protein SBOR_6373 [Sclerotinia borealis F-4128]|uniref:Uncharacterized protein n=1 Tax=Sclerotinia borealis (strain F-4128) TaxID=1432307 RepID=W9CBS5_SCLBF|nr:hypothetical protein SBOR_6373 [Sclerotinia borealis F-4128]